MGTHGAEIIPSDPLCSGGAVLLVRTKNVLIDYINGHSFLCVWMHHFAAWLRL